MYLVDQYSEFKTQSGQFRHKLAYYMDHSGVLDCKQCGHYPRGGTTPWPTKINTNEFSIIMLCDKCRDKCFGHAERYSKSLLWALGSLKK